jgi:hypothetical protein
MCQQLIGPILASTVDQHWGDELIYGGNAQPLMSKSRELLFIGGWYQHFGDTLYLPSLTPMHGWSLLLIFASLFIGDYSSHTMK